MEIIIGSNDHPKEYFYKITSDGQKNFYHRTNTGHRRIAKNKLPTNFIDRIKPFDSSEDQDPLKSKYITEKKLNKTIQQLEHINTHRANISDRIYNKSKRILEDRIKSMRGYIKQMERVNNDFYERRYREETSAYGGFKSYFKKKYQKYINVPKNNQYSVLIDEKIIQDENTPIKIAKKAYRRWLVKNHPDKGGNSDLCAAVIGAFKSFESNST